MSQFCHVSFGNIHSFIGSGVGLYVSQEFWSGCLTRLSVVVLLHVPGIQRLSHACHTVRTVTQSVLCKYTGAVFCSLVCLLLRFTFIVENRGGKERKVLGKCVLIGQKKQGRKKGSGILSRRGDLLGCLWGRRWLAS